MKRIVALALPIALAFACAPDGLSSTCRFTGDTTKPCGQCIAKSCQTQVDACCDDTVCQEFLSGLDTCANGGSCSSITLGTSSSLESCITTSCSNACSITSSTTLPDAGKTPSTDAGPTYSVSCSATDRDGCICTPYASGKVACDADTVTVEGHLGFCCADRGWPKSGTDCLCHPYTCDPDTKKCQSRDLYTSVYSVTGTRCCANAIGCECRSSFDSCYYNEVEVSECSVTYAQCGTDKTRVDSCSD